jgi:hypothetical protein
VLKDFFNHLGLVDEANDSHFACYRKETSHLLELFCSKKIEKVETRILTPSGGWLQYNPETPIEDDEWQRAEVTHPFDPKLHEEVLRRFRKVIHATPTNLPDREYGNKLVCEKCDGNGFYLTEKRQIKKACTACNETGKVLEPRLGVFLRDDNALGISALIFDPF